MQALDELTPLLKQRTWDKELVLWSGPEQQLAPALNGLHVETIDLLDLFDPVQPAMDNEVSVDDMGSSDRSNPVQLPLDDDEVRMHLSRSLRCRLQTISRRPGKKIVLVVRSAGLLARYRVGVHAFYEWFCDDFSMAFLLVERPPTKETWPDQVDGCPDRLLEYFADTGMTKRQFRV